MLRLKNKNKSSSTIEYITVVVIVIWAMLIFRTYIIQAMSGRWKSMGDTFGQGREYDPSKTIKCAYDYQYHNVWYNLDCYEQQCECFYINRTVTSCQNCITNCRTTKCDPMGGDEI